MEFKIEKNVLSISFLDQMIHNFRAQNLGHYPTRILLSPSNTTKLVYEVRNAFSGFNAKPPYKAFGIKIVRCLDIDEDTMELLK